MIAKQPLWVDPEVREFLRSRANGFETVNELVRRLLGMPESGIRRGRPKGVRNKKPREKQKATA